MNETKQRRSFEQEERTEPSEAAPPRSVERLFFAMVPDPAARAELASFARKLASRGRVLSGEGSPRSGNARWIAEEQYHLTLKFLGETDGERKALCTEAARRVAREHAPFELGFGEIGAFPGPKRPSVLFVGATDGANAVIRLATELDTALAASGMRREGRPYTAHLTLARARGGRAAAELAALLRDEGRAPAGMVGRCTIVRFVLMASEPQKGGVRYRVVDEYPLLGPPADPMPR